MLTWLTANLYDFIHSPRADQRVDSTLLLQFAFDIARGMQYLHSQSIIITTNKKQVRKERKKI